MLLINNENQLTPVIKILTDYSRDDLAHDEVHQSLVTACIKNDVNFRNLDVGAITGMDTVASGFKIAQLAMNSNLGFGHIFHSNCAPRKNFISSRSRGEKIVLGITNTGVTMLIVNSGYSLSPFYHLAKRGEITFFQTTVKDSGSQFRSRDFFPFAIAELARHLQDKTAELGKDKIGQLIKDKSFKELFDGLEFLDEEFDITHINKLNVGSVLYVDNFGNIKLNYYHERILKQYKSGTNLLIKIGETVQTVNVAGVGFSQREGILALTEGSSGWVEEGHDKSHFSEIFLRGGSAASLFKKVAPGDRIVALDQEIMNQVIDILKESADNEAVSESLDLYNLSEAKILDLLSHAKLIRRGYDVSNLKKAIKDGNLIEKLV